MKKTLSLVLALLMLSMPSLAAPSQTAVDVENADEVIESTVIPEEQQAVLSAENTSALENKYVLLYGEKLFFDDFEGDNHIPVVTADGSLPTLEYDENGNHYMHMQNDYGFYVGDGNGYKAPDNAVKYQFKATHNYTVFGKFKLAKTMDSSDRYGISFPNKENYTLYTDSWLDSYWMQREGENNWWYELGKGKTAVFSPAQDITTYAGFYFSTGNGGSPKYSDMYIDDIGAFGKPKAEYANGMTFEQNGRTVYFRGAVTAEVQLHADIAEYAANAINACTAPADVFGADVKAVSYADRVLTLTFDGTGEKQFTVPSLETADSGNPSVIPAASFSFTAEKAAKVDKNAFLYGKKIYFEDFESENPNQGRADKGIPELLGDSENHYLYVTNSPFFIYPNDGTGNNAKKISLVKSSTYTMFNDFKLAPSNTAVFNMIRYGQGWSTIHAEDLDVKLSTDSWTTMLRKFSPKEDLNDFVASIFQNNYSGAYPDIYIDNVGLYELPETTETITDWNFNTAENKLEIVFAHGLDEAAVLALDTYKDELVEGVLSAKTESRTDGTVLVLTLDKGTDIVKLPALCNAAGTASYPATAFAAPATDSSAYIRTKTPQAMRYKGYVSDTLRANAEEYGFLIATAKDLGDKELVFGSEINGEDKLNYTPDNVKFVYGAAYIKNSRDLIFDNDRANGRIGFAGALTGIKAANYDSVLAGRTYVKVDGNYYYGETISKSIREVAKEIKAREDYDSLEESVKKVIDNIVSDTSAQ